MNDNEFLTIDDIESLLMKLGQKKFTEEERAHFLRVLDLDNDGQITFSDFQMYIEILGSELLN